MQYGAPTSIRGIDTDGGGVPDDRDNYEPAANEDQADTDPTAPLAYPVGFEYHTNGDGRCDGDEINCGARLGEFYIGQPIQAALDEPSDLEGALAGTMRVIVAGGDGAPPLLVEWE